MLNVAATYRKTSKERERRGFLSATPERMAKTGEPFQSIQTEEMGATIETQTVTASPLSRLYKSGQLKGHTGDPKTDEHIANLRNEAGEKLYALWFYGRSFSLGSRDYRRAYAGASNDPYSLAPSQERVEHSRRQYRKAQDELGNNRVSAATHSIVIDEKDPLDVGRVLTNRNHEGAARAVAVEFLIEGLDKLRAMWGMDA